MERKECCEVPIYGLAKVSPGYYYDHETRHFSKAQDLEHIKTKKEVNFKFETFNKRFLENVKTSKILSKLMWAIDYDKETPVDAILIKGRKCLEETGLEVPEDKEMCRVLSVLYNYPANLLLCFNEEIPGDVFNTFEGHLHTICSQSSNNVVFSNSLVDKFVCGYIYPIYSESGTKFDKFIYGIKAFCSVLREAIVSTLPISAIVDKQSSSYKNKCSVNVGDSVSDGFKANVKSESNVEVLLETKNTVETIKSDNIANVHSISNTHIKQASVGHGITKSSGIKGEIASSPGVSVGRGRGTMKGRGNIVGSSTQNMESTTRVGESRTKESIQFSMDGGLQNFCDNYYTEIVNTPVISLNTNSANVKKVTKNMNDISVEYLHEHEKRKSTDMVTNHTLVVPKVSSLCASNAPSCPKSEILTDHRHHTHGLNRSCGNEHQDNNCILSHSDRNDVLNRGHVDVRTSGSDHPYHMCGLNSSCGNQHVDNDCRVSQSDNRDLFRVHPLHVNISGTSKQVITQDIDFYQSKIVEQNKDQVIRGEKSFTNFDLLNSESTLTMSEECNKTLQEDNVNKSVKGSPSYSEFHEDSNDKPAFNTRSGNVKKETRPANELPKDDHRKSQDTKVKDISESKVTMKESTLKKSAQRQICNSTISVKAEPAKELPRGDIKKSEYDDKKSQDTKVKDTSKSKMTVKESIMKSAQRQNCNSTISEIAEKKMGHNQEIKKSKNAEERADPNKYSQVETNSVQQKELFQGLMCNEDQDEKSYLKIGKQDNCKVKTYKEKNQMKSTFLEADKTANGVLGFQRKYYGVVNNTSLEKVILLLGASGSGKTTLVNLAANYFKEKKSADEELYHVVTTSPTSEITAYTFCSAPDEIPITIIDTPGLNDSSGAEVRDHIQSLKTFLANASASEFQIHAIGFVAQAYLVRLTSSERLVMDYVSTIFGQGVKEHLITLVTFADNQDNPPVVEAMKNYGVSFKLSLKFNNSALHNNKAEEVDDIDRVYWRVCWRNWKKCMKTLRDMSPLSVSTMKAVHSEVFASTILKSTERDLTANLKTFFGYSKEDRISSKEASKVVAEIWNLAAVLHHFRSVNNALHSKHEDILIEFGTEICKEKQISAKENICFLSLGPETPLIVSGLQVIQTMASLYKQSKSWHTKSNTLSRNITEWTYCHICDKDHKMNRLERGTLKKWVRLEEDVVALKCTNCKCAGEVHGVSKTKSPFHPDIVLEKTYTALQNVIRQYSIPNFPIREDWYLEFLNQHCLEHTDFIKDIRTLIKK